VLLKRAELSRGGPPYIGHKGLLLWPLFSTFASSLEKILKRFLTAPTSRQCEGETVSLSQGIAAWFSGSIACDFRDESWENISFTRYCRLILRFYTCNFPNETVLPSITRYCRLILRFYTCDFHHSQRPKGAYIHFSKKRFFVAATPVSLGVYLIDVFGCVFLGCLRIAFWRDKSLYEDSHSKRRPPLPHHFRYAYDSSLVKWDLTRPDKS